MITNTNCVSKNQKALMRDIDSNAKLLIKLSPPANFGGAVAPLRQKTSIVLWRKRFEYFFKFGIVDWQKTHADKKDCWKVEMLPSSVGSKTKEYNKINTKNNFISVDDIVVASICRLPKQTLLAINSHLINEDGLQIIELCKNGMRKSNQTYWEQTCMETVEHCNLDIEEVVELSKALVALDVVDCLVSLSVCSYINTCKQIFEPADVVNNIEDAIALISNSSFNKCIACTRASCGDLYETYENFVYPPGHTCKKSIHGSGSNVDKKKEDDNKKLLNQLDIAKSNDKYEKDVQAYNDNDNNMVLVGTSTIRRSAENSAVVKTTKSTMSRYMVPGKFEQVGLCVFCIMREGFFKFGRLQRQMEKPDKVILTNADNVIVDMEVANILSPEYLPVNSVVYAVDPETSTVVSCRILDVVLLTWSLQYMKLQINGKETRVPLSNVYLDKIMVDLLFEHFVCHDLFIENGKVIVIKIPADVTQKDREKVCKIKQQKWMARTIQEGGVSNVVDVVKFPFSIVKRHLDNGIQL